MCCYISILLFYNLQLVYESYGFPGYVNVFQVEGLAIPKVEKYSFCPTVKPLLKACVQWWHSTETCWTGFGFSVIGTQRGINGPTDLLCWAPVLAVFQWVQSASIRLVNLKGGSYSRYLIAAHSRWRRLITCACPAYNKTQSEDLSSEIPYRILALPE